MRATLRILFPVGPLGVTSLSPNGTFGREHIRVDQLEDRFVNHAYGLFNEACRDLRVGKNLKALRTRVARLKLLTGHLAKK
jgi:hypothetical protein